MRHIGNFSFDRIPSFREYPALYILIVTIGIGLSAVLLVGGFIRDDQRNRLLLDERRTETPKQKENRLAIMNILNRLHLAEAKATESPNEDPAIQVLERRQNLQNAIEALRTIQSGGEVGKAREDLIRLFSRWEEFLFVGQDTSELRNEFVRIGRDYPWLNTLLWLIMLNRL